jgi:hypothetical protein
MKGKATKPQTLTEAVNSANWRLSDLPVEDQEAIREGIEAFDDGEEGIPAEDVIAALRRKTAAARKARR